MKTYVKQFWFRLMAILALGFLLCALTCNDAEVKANGYQLLSTEALMGRSTPPVKIEKNDASSSWASLRKSFLHQDTYSIKHQAPIAFGIDGTGAAGFQVGSQDRGALLAIGSILDFSTFYGGGRIDQASAIATDTSGYTYVAGVTFSDNFRTTQLDTTFGGPSDAFVMKLSPRGELVYSTFLGGSSSDSAAGIAVDASGNVYVTGGTTSTDFPVMAAYQNKLAGQQDAFLTVINNTGDRILWSSYLGGSSNDHARAIGVAANGSVWVAGVTQSDNLPVLNAAQTRPAGKEESFVASFDDRGQLLFSTYIGGGENDRVGFGGSLAVSDSGIFIAGATDSPDFPSTPGVIQPTKRAAFDAFVTKIAYPGFKIEFSTFVGGSGDDGASSIARDAEGNLWATGGTRSADFPTTANAFQKNSNGLDEAFIVKLNGGGERLTYSSYLGSRGPDSGLSLCLDLSGNAYVTGSTANVGPVTEPLNFPMVNPLQSRYGGGFSDAFVTKVSADGATILFSTFLGGNDADTPGAISVDAFRNIHVAGVTSSPNFPVAAAIQQSLIGSPDAFIAGIGENITPGSLTCVSAASYFRDGMLARNGIVAAFGNRLAGRAEAAGALPLPVSVAGTYAVITNVTGLSTLAPVFFVSPGQMNFLLPDEINNGEVAISVFSRDGGKSVCRARIENVSPGLFAANGNGMGVAAAVALRVGETKPPAYEPVMRFDPVTNRYQAIPIDLEGDGADKVFLLLFGTGVRERKSLGDVGIKVGAIDAPVMFAGAQGNHVGLDQINLELPRSLKGAGEVSVQCIVEGKASNQVTVMIK